jgi:two-component system, NarL family, invasion response regulator UvrY
LRLHGGGDVAKILLVDDHAIVRRGIRQILEEHLGAEAVFDEAGSGAEALTKFLRDSYDLVLLDISLQDMSGLDLLKRLKQERNCTPVLILTLHPEEQYAFHSLKAGADGYLTKMCAPEELVTAVNKLLSGGKFISSFISEALISHLRNVNSKGLFTHAILSDREFRVFCDIASGKSPKEIAEQLCLSIKTISTYRARVMQKMRMKKNADIVSYAIKNGLVE